MDVAKGYVMNHEDRLQRMKTLHDQLWDSVLYNKGDWWTLLEAYTGGGGGGGGGRRRHRSVRPKRMLHCVFL